MSKSLLAPTFQYPAYIHVIGTSFRELAVDDREALTRLMKNEGEVLSELKTKCGFSEAALVSTCLLYTSRCV